jgi:hypothetical protein
VTVRAPVARYTSWNELTPRHAPVLDDAARASFFRSVPWFKALAATSLDPGDTVALYVAGQPPALILPLRRPPRRLSRPSVLSSLANFYSCDFAPLARADAAGADHVAAVARSLLGEKPRIDVVNLTSLPAETDALRDAAQGFADAGWWVQRYFHFATWYERTAGITAADYLAARPPALRNTVRRKASALRKANDARIEVLGGGPALVDAALDTAIAAYEHVYRASWKVREPYPAFAASFIRAAAELGCLRLGLVHIGELPVAAQIWIVWRGHATLCKLAHDERVAARSVGSVLTWRMIEHVLDVDRVDEIDFGRGDDPFKRLWMSERREHWGLLAFNPSTPFGLLTAARHLGGRRVARFARRWLPVNRARP